MVWSRSNSSFIYALELLKLLVEASIHVALLWRVALTLLALLLILTYIYI
jgi:hypothetical protein